MTDVLVVIGVGGMGEAIAHRLAAGRLVVVADIDPDRLDRVADALVADGHRVEAHRVDVASRAHVHDLARRAADLGRIVQVAHTAGVSPVQASTRRILEVDLLGAAHTVDAFGAVIAPGGAGVVVSSMAGHAAADSVADDHRTALATTPTDALLDLAFLDPEQPPGAAYGVAKLANQLRVHRGSLAWGRRGARLNSISPGVVSTAMGRAELAGPHGDVMRRMTDVSGTGRVGTPSDIAAAAAFLLGPDSSFVTGTDLLVDGGATAAVRSGALAPPH